MISEALFSKTFKINHQDYLNVLEVSILRYLFKLILNNLKLIKKYRSFEHIAKDHQ